MTYLDSLNKGQLEAVETTEGPVRVIAGAGTGKTKALTSRFCYLADALGVDPGSILCVTFTNKAAAEMKQRIRRALGDFDLGYICTFHSFCVRLLKEDIHVLNYPSNFIIIDEDDRTTLLQKVYNDMGLTLKELPIKRAVEYIERRKDASDDYLRYIREFDNEQLLLRSVRNADRFDEIFQRYIYEQKKNYACDFDDIIIFTAHILRNNPQILGKWQQRMQYVMVDEFQDVSPRQYEIARMLSGEHRNLFIVGDPDQTIYTWRGADVRMFLDFPKLYPDQVTIEIGLNYRSTPEIVSPGNALIAHNANRYPKSLKAVGPAGEKPLFYHACSEKDEAKWVAGAIRSLVETDGIALHDIAVLYRAHHISRPLEERLIKDGIAYKIYSGTAFYARREVKDVICYLRMLLTADDMAFERTINTPPRGIGKKKMAFLRSEAARTGETLMETLSANISSPMFAHTKAAAYIGAIGAVKELVATLPLGDILQKILDLSGYEEFLRNLSEWERLDNLAELKRAIEEAGHDEDATLEDFVSRVALLTNYDGSRDETDSLRLMTVHTAKGMEFPYVFVYGMNEGAFPSRRSSSPEEIEEERRLAYVAITRAGKGLFMSDSEGFNHDNTGKATSRFVYEMGLENLRFDRPVPPQPSIQPQPSNTSSKARFRSGDTVMHKVFGRGMIMEVDAGREVYTIQFDKLTTPRTLRFAAPLEPYDPEKYE